MYSAIHLIALLFSSYNLLMFHLSSGETVLEQEGGAQRGLTPPLLHLSVWTQPATGCFSVLTYLNPVLDLIVAAGDQHKDTFISLSSTAATKIRNGCTAGENPSHHMLGFQT